MTRPRSRLLLVSTACALGGLLAACSTPESAPAVSSPAASSASPSPSPSPSASPTPTPTPTPTPSWVSPLTGLPGDGPSPVLVVKLDNTQYAQPHAGLTKADLVYLEEVEYGITRIAAVFSSAIPDRIGPVRSARITDIDLVAQFDRPAFAYSGAQRRMFPVLDAADFHDVSPRRGGEGYSRDGSRRAPYNYYADGSVLLARAPKASDAADIGLVFDEAVPPGGLTATTASMKWGYSSASFTYRPKLGRYAVRLNGQAARAEEDERGQSASTVVIQYVKQKPSEYFDKGGGNTPHAFTVGEGDAIVMRDGLAWDVHWSRPSADVGTTFTRADGSPMPFKPGQSWIVLRDRTRPATVKPLTPPVSQLPAGEASMGSAAASSAASATTSATPGAQ